MGAQILGSVMKKIFRTFQKLKESNWNDKKDHGRGNQHEKVQLIRHKMGKYDSSISTDPNFEIFLTFFLISFFLIDVVSVKSPNRSFEIHKF